MTVSKIASKIYQKAKAACKGAWNWRLEWSRAMKKAVKKIMTTGGNKMNDLAQATKKASPRINTYYFSDGSYCDAPRLEEAILIQRAAGNSTSPTRMQKGKCRPR